MKVIQKIRPLLSGMLLAFALISIGFMLGKNSIGHTTHTTSFNGNSDHIAVYYMHSTFRCETCNTIEAMTRDLLDNEYAQEIESGLIRWQEVDFQKDKTLARRFDIAASCIVVANVRDGEYREFQRLDNVWTLLNNSSAFDQYIRNAIDVYLAQQRGEQ